MRCSLALQHVVGFALALLGTPTSAALEVEWNALAEKGGAYLAAIVMVQEFKRTNCGPMLDIGNKWLDLSAAEAEIASAFPASRRQELDGMHQMIAAKRMEFRNLFADPNLQAKCEAASNFVWRQFDTAVTEWRAKKAQLVR